LEKKNEQAWEDNGVIYIKEYIYIPNNWKIQEQIVQKSYEQRMLKLIKRNY